MAKYVVQQDSFINGVYVKAGEVVEYAGEPAGNLMPVVEAAAPAQDDEQERNKPKNQNKQ